MQLAIPVAPGTPVGTTVYFYRAGQFLNADGTTQPIWWQVESGTVESNGMAYTHSPPEQGVANSGYYLLGYGTEELSDFEMELNRDQIEGAEAGQLDVSVAIDGANGSLTGAMASVDEQRHRRHPGACRPSPEPTPRRHFHPSAGFLAVDHHLPYVQLEPGQVSTFSSPITVPPPLVVNAPKINNVSLAGTLQAPEVQIDGSGFVEQATSSLPLEVEF